MSMRPLQLPGIFQHRIVQHFVFWTIYIGIYTFVNSKSWNGKVADALFEEAIHLPLKIIFTYSCLYILLPKLLDGRYLYSIGGFVFLSAIVGLLHRLVLFKVTYPLYHPEALTSPFFSFSGITKLNIWAFYPVTFVSISLKLLKHWYASQRMQQELTKEKLEAELKFLKSQIQPHFLFNTLNNLYSLTLKKSDQAPEVVLKLSEMLSYMLYECQQAEVPLHKEISFIHNYIEIEKLRYGSLLDAEFRVSGKVNNWSIAPFILLPFLENAFKHGVSEELKHSHVNVELEVTSEHIIFRIQNSIAKSLKKGANNGIGIVNVTRRLDLLYPERYNLDVAQDNSAYTVTLKIQHLHHEA